MSLFSVDNKFSNESLKQMEMFVNSGITFTSDRKQNEELDVRLGKARAVIRALHYPVVQKSKL